MNPLRRVRAALLAGRLRPPPSPREAAARRALDRLLMLAIAVSLLAAVLERRDRETLDPAPIPSFPVDLAHDPPERLRLLPGLGPTRVAALLDEREHAGPPSTWTDLERVRGIGSKMLEGWREAGATLGSPTPTPTTKGPPLEPAPPTPGPTPAPPTRSSPSGRAAPAPGASATESAHRPTIGPRAQEAALDPVAPPRGEGGTPPDPRTR